MPAAPYAFVDHPPPFPPATGRSILVTEFNTKPNPPIILGICLPCDKKHIHEGNLANQ